MKTKEQKGFLRQIILSIILIVGLIFGMGPKSVRADENDTAKAVAALKESVGDGLVRMMSSSVSVMGVTTSSSSINVKITYDAASNTFHFQMEWPNLHNTKVSFDYDAATYAVKDSIGVIDYDNSIQANANFSTTYKDGDPLTANVVSGSGYYGDSLSALMTTSFSTAMQNWNSMIENATDDKYNMGNIGFTNYVTPVVEKAAETKTSDETTKKSDNSKTTKDAGLKMYRLYNPHSGEHFYTNNNGERRTLIQFGWHDEGIGWMAPRYSKTPVYRLYNPNAGDHHYTTKKSERDALVKAGWKYENIGWYSDDNHGKPLYRQYNPNAKKGTHNYTTSKSENDKLVRLGWRDEGIGWYGVA